MRTLIASLMILAVAGAASAAVTVTGGDHDLQPNTAGQTITIAIATDASDMVTGSVANVQLGTGQSTPEITDIVMTLFASTNGDSGGFTSFAGSGYPGLGTNDFLCTAADGSDDVLGSGVLVTVTIDTTGFSTVGASWALDLSTLNGNLSILYTGSNPGTTVNDGTITIIPEPATMLLLGLGAVAAIIRRR